MVTACQTKTVLNLFRTAKKTISVSSLFFRDVYCSLFPPPGGGGIFSSHLGRFSSCTGGKRRKKEEKGEKGMKKQKEKRKKEEKGTNREKKGGKFGKFFRMNGTIYIPA